MKKKNERTIDQALQGHKNGSLLDIIMPSSKAEDFISIKISPPPPLATPPAAISSKFYDTRRQEGTSGSGSCKWLTSFEKSLPRIEHGWQPVSSTFIQARAPASDSPQCGESCQWQGHGERGEKYRVNTLRR